MSDDGWWSSAAMSAGQSAALSEGFCEPCRAPLPSPSLAVDGDVAVRAAQCPQCHVIYIW